MRHFAHIVLRSLLILCLLPVWIVSAQDPPAPTPAALAVREWKEAAYSNWIGDTVTPWDAAPRVPSSSSAELAVELTEADNWTRTVFQSFFDGNWEIYQFTGLDPHANTARLTYHPASDIRPALNWDSTRIAFASNRDGNYEIYTMTSQGQDLRRLTYHGAADSLPTWSPDGQRIAFSSDRDGRVELYVMNADGSNQTRLTYGQTPSAVDATWSPDGTRIAWIGRDSQGYGTINIINADGSGYRQISPTTYAYAADLSWSPDGTRLAFDGDLNGDLWTDLAIINVNGGAPQIVEAGALPVDNWAASWLPGRNALLYDRVVYTVYNNQLYISSITLMRCFLPDGPREVLRNSNYDLYHRTQSTDNTIPFSQVNPLPPYSRAKDTFVTWQGGDAGPAPLSRYDVQTRTGQGGAWTDWMKGSAYSLEQFKGTPGTTVYFRSRAHDRAENAESWPAGTGDAHTTFYSWQLGGRITDNRGVPMPEVGLTIDPAPLLREGVNLYGRYLAYGAAEGNHILRVNQPGYAPTTIPVDLTADRVANFYLGPEDNIIRNGDMEDGADQPADWLVEGTLTTTLTTVGVGHRAAQMGLEVPDPGFSKSSQDASYALAVEEIFADDAGNLHTIGLKSNGQAVCYAYRPAGGAWQDLIELGKTGSIEAHYGLPDLAMDGLGTLHAVWQYSEKGTTRIFYAQKPQLAAWSTPVPIATGRSPTVAADGQGGVHVAYRGSGGIYYLGRMAQGNWGAPMRVNTSANWQIPSLWEVCDVPEIAVGPDNVAHVLWHEIFIGAFHRARNSSGAWTTVEKVLDSLGSRDYLSGYPRAAVADDGTLHTFWPLYERGIYANRSPDGEWSDRRVLPKARGYGDLAVDHDGFVHLAVRSLSGFARYEGTSYRFRSPTGEWSDPHIFPNREYNVPYIAVYPQGQVYATWSLEGSQTAQLAEQDEQARLSQTVTIPADMHRPTLSFRYDLTKPIAAGHGDFAASRLAVIVDDGASSTEVWATSAQASGAQGWVDMAPWAGQTVTVTLCVQQAAGEPPIRVTLDDVSLGSWKTPVVQAVTVEPGPGTAGFLTLDITGDNLMPGATLHVGETPIDHVEWVDEQTLRGTLPLDLPPGIHPVWVTNPEGQRSVLPSGIAWGQQLYLPRVMR